MAGLLALVGLGTVVGYVFTPQPNLPGSFVYDFRFSLLTFLSGVIALPIALGRSRWVSLLVPIYGAVMVGTQFARGIWFGEGSFYTPSIGEGLLVGIPVVVIGLGLIVALHLGLRWFLRSALLVSIVLVAVAIVAGLPLQNSFLANWDTQAPYPGIDRWASTVHHARIGVSGLIQHYPLYGSDLTNEVEFLGTPGPHNTYFAIDTCSKWRQAINDGKFQFVVTVRDYTKAVPSSVTWTQTDPAAKVVTSEITGAADGFQQIAVYAINGPMSVSGCPSG